MPVAMTYRPVLGSQFQICESCGSLVVEDSKAVHDAFHESLGSSSPEQPGKPAFFGAPPLEVKEVHNPHGNGRSRWSISTRHRPDEPQ